jgi:hypothetical protein
MGDEFAQNQQYHDLGCLNYWNYRAWVSLECAMAKKLQIFFKPEVSIKESIKYS